MTFQPIFDLRATTIRKAFILNAIVLAAVATLSIELRRYLDKRKETKDITEAKKVFLRFNLRRLLWSKMNSLHGGYVVFSHFQKWHCCKF